MNWLQKISTSPGRLINAIESRGWSEEQIRKDALDVWRDGNRLFFSVGDWAKISTDDITSAIKEIFPGSEIEGDCEAGPGEGNWKKIL